MNDADSIWGRPPVDVGPSRWILPSDALPDEDGFVAVGADLEPATLIASYRNGLFPMPVGRRRLGWFSPDPRGILPLDGLRVTRSLRQSMKRYEVTVDRSFREVMQACGDPKRPHGWINGDFVGAYSRLHELGWAHSFECRSEDGALVGGLYGIRIDGFFAGESMFSVERDASKVALVALVEAMRAAGMELLDVQWVTPHLASLGAIAVPRSDYLVRLAHATMRDAL